MRLRAALTEDKADEVLDPLRVAFLIAFAVGMALQIYTVIAQGQPFDIQAFGIGMGSLLATTGAALWASSQQKDEPAA
jgi:hypothetical protein